jgi:hypothetical protein
MTHYCNTPSCRGALNSLIEMEPIRENLDNIIYRCPLCQKTRREDYYMFSAPVARDVTGEDVTDSTRTSTKIVAGVGVALVIAALLSRG